ncbi:hypothetical protein E4T48_00429 [Aureobasidium sp. EXF-10727]|nr:hypothetical protein E4T48_00429 [Aureobasidium sp. EXF-10727]KAI4729704.1 hypothetical protein E4T49_02482 [Aureobasidium sp. EXF-10728]
MSAPNVGPQAPSSAHDLESQHSSERSPLSNFGFLKNLGLDKKQTKDGAAPKRRGPKPDSKPALTRRQELNRQAQRTHRERKEMYIKALEHEVLRLKELYGSSISDRDAVVSENKRLKELLLAHGIPLDSLQSLPAMRGMPASYNGSSSGSISGSYAQDSSTAGFSPPPLRSQDSKPMASAAQLPTQHLDYDQIGIDFVLTLERPCMDHMQYLVVRSHNPEGQPFHHPMERPDDTEYDHMCGHALMATCPPASHIMNKPGDPYGHRMPDLKAPDLMKLLDLSAQLPLEGELTPVMAWMLLLQNSRVSEMTAQDFELVKADLAGKVRCYGFGAVLEEFEVRDALSNLFIAKENMTVGQVAMPQQIEAY